MENSLFSFIHRNNIVSIAILNHDDIEHFLKKIPDDMNLEINISCPNTEDDLVKTDIQKFLNPNRKICSLKCSPLLILMKLIIFIIWDLEDFIFLILFQFLQEEVLVVPS